MVINGTFSDLLPVVSGVLLGPLLLSLYMDDISHWFAHSSVQMFADDIALYKEITSPSDLELLDIDLSISKGFAHKCSFVIENVL